MSLCEIQKILVNGVEGVKALGLPSLGPVYAGLSGSDLHNSLVSHRLTKKFEVKDDKKSVRRKDKSIRKFISTNDSVSPTFSCWDLTSDNRALFLRARAVLREILAGFRPSYGFAFPSGEGFHSSGGKTDFLDKLRNEDQWSVSVGSLPYAARIAYKNHSLKRVVKDRFKHRFPNWRYKSRKWAYDAYKANRQIGPYVFQRMFFSLCDIVGTARVTTVPKNNDVDRVISCEATWNMVAQLSLALDVRALLKARTGIDIRYWQQVHRALIRSGRSTIDFSEASDRLSLGLFKSLFPESVVKHFLQVRSTSFELDEEYHAFNMLAPMGSGFTFDILTLTLISLARSLDPAATSFGDDVILASDKALGFISLAEECGFKVNTDKSFIHGNFRESCGAFCDLTTDSLLESYDFEYPTSMEEAYICINKLGRLREILPPGPLRTIVSTTFENCLPHVRRDTVLPKPWDGCFSEWLVTTSASVETSEVLFDTKSPSVALWGTQWGRRIVLVQRPSRSAQRSTSHTVRSYEHLAAVLRRGMFYLPDYGSKVRLVYVDRESGVPLSAVTLASII